MCFHPRKCSLAFLTPEASDNPRFATVQNVAVPILRIMCWIRKMQFREDQNASKQGDETHKNSFAQSYFGKRHFGLVAEHLLSMEKLLASVPGISTQKDQAVSGMKDLLLNLYY